MEKKYSIQEITMYLEEQQNLDAAITNINSIGFNRKTIRDSKGKIVFYIPIETKTKGEVKALVIDYMEKNGIEKNDYEEVMKLQEILDSLEWKIE